MKVKINKYATWFGPYQLMNWLFYPLSREGKYLDREYPDWHEKLSDWYAYSRIGKAHMWLGEKWMDFWNDRRVKIELDRWDTWNMDETLAHIILPMLKQLKETKHGSPMVDDEDVPAHYPRQQWSQNESRQLDMFADDASDELIWKQYEARWNYVLDEMIWSFETLAGNNTDWESQFFSGELDRITVPVDAEGNEVPDEEAKFFEWRKGPNDTSEFDKEGYIMYNKRIENGFRLFGKYYRGLWD